MNQELERALRRAETGAILVTEGRRTEGLRLVTSAAYSLLAWTASSLPMRDGNEGRLVPPEGEPAGFKPSYEGWKRDHDERWGGLFPASSLPMRDGNPRSSMTSSRRNFASSLPMRDGNYDTGGRWPPPGALQAFL